MRRIDAGVTYRYYLPRNWFASLDLTFLSNTEQSLKLRSGGRGGAGKFLINSNKAYWGLGGGFSFNNEQYTVEVDSRNNLELFAASELNLFDTGDLHLTSYLYAFPSLSEKGRFRSDFNIDLKYDLPKDLYFKVGLTLNYDNRPAVAGRETDYVFYTSVGWSL